MNEYNDWKITEDGDLLHVEKDYLITKNRFQEIDWVSHMIQKGWCDMNTFIPAYLAACKRNNMSVIQVMTVDWPLDLEKEQLLKQ